MCVLVLVLEFVLVHCVPCQEVYGDHRTAQGGRACYEWPAAHILRTHIAFWISNTLSCAPLCAFGVLVLPHQHLSYFQMKFLQGLLLRRGFAAARSVLLGKPNGRVKNSFQNSPSTHTATFCTKQHCMLRTQNVVSAPSGMCGFPVVQFSITRSAP